MITVLYCANNNKTKAEKGMTKAKNSHDTTLSTEMERLRRKHDKKALNRHLTGIDGPELT